MDDADIVLRQVDQRQVDEFVSVIGAEQDGQKLRLGLRRPTTQSLLHVEIAKPKDIFDKFQFQLFYIVSVK